MKPTQFYIAVALGAICLILSIALIALGQSNQHLQMEAQSQQAEINKGSMSQQIGTNIVRDIAQLSVKNEKLKEVLTKNGFNISVNPPAGSASPTPGADNSSSPTP
jgi:predicted Holliday junction resolvase-like endonuclease